MTDDGHKYTQYGFNGSYWEKKAAREKALHDEMVAEGWFDGPELTGLQFLRDGEPEPKTEAYLTWVGENGLTWIFIEEDNDDNDNE